MHGGSAEDALLSAALVLVEQGADVIILGCAVRLITTFTSPSDESQGMAPLTQTMEKKIRDKTDRHIPVIDGVQAAIETAIGLARMGLRI